MRILDQSSWNRREHFEFFRTWHEPYFGATVEVDVTKIYDSCKARNIPFFWCYQYLAHIAIHDIEEFRYRIIGNDVVIYDRIDVATTILRADKTFSFSVIPFSFDFDVFLQSAQAIVARIQQTTGLNANKDADRVDLVHYSALPWLRFTSFSHARHFDRDVCVPKISFGKITTENGKRLMPLSVHVAHSLMDGYHLGLYVERFQALLNEGEVS